MSLRTTLFMLLPLNRVNIQLFALINCVQIPVDSLKAGNTANTTSRCCSLPAATSVVSSATKVINTIHPLSFTRLIEMAL